MLHHYAPHLIIAAEALIVSVVLFLSRHGISRQSRRKTSATTVGGGRTVKESNARRRKAFTERLEKAHRAFQREVKRSLSWSRFDHKAQELLRVIVRACVEQAEARLASFSGDAGDADADQRTLTAVETDVIALETLVDVQRDVMPQVTARIRNQLVRLAPVLREYRDTVDARVRDGLERGYPLNAAAAALSECDAAAMVERHPEDAEPLQALMRMLEQLQLVDAAFLAVESSDACNDGIVRIGAAKQHERLEGVRTEFARLRSPETFVIPNTDGTAQVNWYAVRYRLADLSERVAAIQEMVAGIVRAMTGGPVDPVLACDELIKLEGFARGVITDVNEFVAAVERAHDCVWIGASDA